MLVLYLGALAYACFAHSEMLPSIHNWPFGIPFDKVAHFCMFVPFPVLMYLSMERIPTLVKIILALALGFMLAGGTEYIQGLTAYRDKDILDFAADTVGLAVGSIVSAVSALFCGRRQTR